MSNYPADLANEALDAAGVDFTIGEPQEGTKPAQVVLRHYGQCLRQLLRAVHWDFCRQLAPLTMLADATGNTVGVGTVVIPPWTYEYAYPINCMKARFLPQNYLNPNSAPAGNITLPTTPPTTVADSALYGMGMRLVPSPFLVSMDTNYIINLASNWLDTQGTSPTGRVVILSNVNVAQLVYTAFMPYPSVWDAQFRAAFVAYLASMVALPLAKDKAFGVKMREAQMAIARDKVMAARVTNGNESAFPTTTDHLPDWMRLRNMGGGAWSGGIAPSCSPWGLGGYGWDGCGFMGYGFDTSVF